jgi:arginyl-tRNA synthetase
VTVAEDILPILRRALEASGVVDATPSLDKPTAAEHGDYASAVCLAAGKRLGQNPKELAEMVADAMRTDSAFGAILASVDVAGPGFLNFRVAPSRLAAELAAILAAGEKYGDFAGLAGKRALLEYSCPNPFKPLHIGHMMANAIGEALSRLYAKAGADVTRVTYGGDVGLHVAKAIWGMEQIAGEAPADDAPTALKVRFVGRAYALGSEAYEGEDPAPKAHIADINTRVFSGQTTESEKRWYERGRAWSIAHFHEMYEAIGSRFDHEVWEKEVEARGKKIVTENLGKVFEESDGAVVYKGEKVGLHTRVFLTSKGLPAYEAKEIGWAFEKEDRYHPDLAVLVTASEQLQYFKVVQAALAEIEPSIPAKTSHVTHGMMRLADGKISSRKGNAMIALDLLEAARDKSREVIGGRGFSPEEEVSVANSVAVAAIKYQILKQSPGKDIVFDLDQATSLVGESGPYIQYAATRARSVAAKAKEAGIAVVPSAAVLATDGEPLVAILARTPDAYRRAFREKAPQHVAQHLLEISAAWNGFYERRSIVSAESPEAAAHRLAVAEATFAAVSAGLDVLGVSLPPRM